MFCRLRQLIICPKYSRAIFQSNNVKYAVPFSINTKQATHLFEKHLNTERLFYYPNQVKNRSITANFVPYYVFNTTMEISYTGELGFDRTIRTSYTDADGKTRYRTRTKTDYYTMKGIKVPHSIHRGRDDQEMFYYADTHFRRGFVQEVMKHTPIDNLEPITRHSFPYGASSGGGIHPFSIKPSLAFSEVKDGIIQIASKIARRHLKANPHLVQSRYSIPSSYYVYDVKVKHNNIGLDQEAGLIYLPLWVCDYSYGGSSYRLFLRGNHTGVSDFNEDNCVSGVIHRDLRNSILTFTSMGFVVSGVLGLLLSSGSHTANTNNFVPVFCAGGALFGALIGRFWASHSEDYWDSDREKLEAQKVRNIEWTTDVRWMDRCNKVLQQQLKRYRREHPEGAGGQSSSSGYSRYQRSGSRRRGHYESSNKSESTGKEETHHYTSSDWISYDDYKILDLKRYPPPSKRDIGIAFRKQAMIWHPDHHVNESDLEIQNCSARFRRIVEAHTKMRQYARK